MTNDRTILARIFLGLLSLELVLLLYTRITGQFTASDIVRTLLLISGMLGVYGYTHNKALLNKYLWRAVFVASCIWEVGYLVFMDLYGEIEPIPKEFLVSMMAGYFIYYSLHITMVVILYLYAFHCRVWDHATPSLHSGT